MSTVSLPSYVAPSLNRTPSYSAEPGDFEHRLALGERLRIRPSGSFVKESKGGAIRLRLSSQEENITLPVYGASDVVEGVVELSKPDGVTSVEVQESDCCASLHFSQRWLNWSRSADRRQTASQGDRRRRNSKCKVMPEYGPSMGEKPGQHTMSHRLTFRPQTAQHLHI